ncbi:MAG TPA: GNAT family N-acetyltransferase [Candidatus Eisenbacteria bacterium]
MRVVASPSIDSECLNALFTAAWPAHEVRDFDPVLARSLACVCAFAGDRLVGFVNIAWDGGAHAFLLDPTVHPDFRRQGIGTELVAKAASEARARGAEWLHVDYEPSLGKFYRRCGFQPTSAGLIKLVDCGAK